MFGEAYKLFTVQFLDPNIHLNTLSSNLRMLYDIN